MSARIRIPQKLYEDIQADLARSHAHAYERVGFLYCRRVAAIPNPILLAVEYQPVADANYIADSSVGARIGSMAIHDALQRALTLKASALHTHLHAHEGATSFSTVDLECLADLAPSFARLLPHEAHGGIVFSMDHATARIWSPSLRRLVPVQGVSVIGRPVHVWENR